MPRTVSMRRNYQGDIAHLTRLAIAIEKDTRKTVQWKRKTMDAVNQVIYMLLDMKGVDP